MTGQNEGRKPGVGTLVACDGVAGDNQRDSKSKQQEKAKGRRGEATGRGGCGRYEGRAVAEAGGAGHGAERRELRGGRVGVRV